MESFFGKKAKFQSNIFSALQNIVVYA